MHFDIVTYYLLKNIKYFDKLTVNNLTVSSKGTLNITPSSLSDLSAIVNKEYIDKVVSSYGVLYYMYDEIDTETGYKLCKLEPSSLAETYIEKTGLVDGDYIDGWISPSENTPDRLLKGVYNWNITLEKTSGTKTLRIYWKLIERKSDNTEVEIATSSLSNEITSKETFIVPLQLDNDYILSEGSRIVSKIYASVSGGGNAPSIRIYYQGNTSSRWEIPIDLNFYAGVFLPLNTDSAISASISGNQWLSVSTSGIVGLPSQSICMLYQSTQQTISSDVDTKIILDAKLLDTQNEGDTTNYRITVSEDGIYLLIGQVGWIGADVIADKVVATNIKVNGDLKVWTSNHTSRSEAIDCITITLQQLSAGDYIELYAKQTFGVDARVDNNQAHTFLIVAKIA